MAAITPSTFNPLERYVNVRMQQGVPIVDADLNELDDIRKFELRAFLKWFVGDGVPDGSDGFQVSVGEDGTGVVVGAGAPAGVVADTAAERGLRNVGRMIVDGLDVIIAKDVKLPVPTVTTPGPAAVYLDVWEELVTVDDVPGLRHEGLGVETCARMQRNWRVRARLGAAAPEPGGDDFERGHSYALLAVVRRRPGAAIRDIDIEDRRHRRLQMAPATLVEDVMGVGTDEYRTGLSRPPVSLRDAVNALLRGELPMTSDRLLAPADDPATTDTIARAFLADSRRGVLGVFTQTREDVDQVYITRLSLDDIAAGFSAPVALTSGVAHGLPSVAELSDGSLFVVYQSESAASADIRARQGTFAQLPTADELRVAVTPEVAEDTPFVLAAGSVVTVFFHKTTEQGNNPPIDRWCFRRWSLSEFDWVDQDPRELAPTNTRDRDFHAGVDSTGKIWAMIRAEGLWAVQLDPSKGTLTAPEQIVPAPGGTAAPFVLCPRRGGVWVFWHDGGLFARQFRDGAWAATEQVAGTDASDREPCAVEDADGGLWVIWTRGPDGDRDLFARRRDVLGQWGVPRKVVASPKDDATPFPVAGADTAIWLFWQSDRTDTFRLYVKRIVTAL